VTISVFDLFKVGIGPSSSHTVGPMTAARMFATSLRTGGLLSRVASVHVVLYGSLGLTGRGHGSDKAVLLGLEGDTRAGVDVDAIAARLAAIRESGTMRLLGEHEIRFDPAADLEGQTRAGLLDRWRVMQQCVRRGCATPGTLPGRLSKDAQRARDAQLSRDTGPGDPLHAIDWLTLYALAGNEENAAGGRVVTAPTNDDAGHRPGHAHQVQGDLTRRPGRQRHRMLIRVPPPRTPEFVFQ
jgi:L-serine deaminase